MRRRLDLAASPDRPAAADLPRRADDRPRPAHPRADVGHDPRAGARRRHRAADDAVPRRGRPARRPDRGHRPRPQGRRGHAGRAEGQRRQLDAAVRLEDATRTAEAAALVARVLGDEPVLTPEAGGINIALPDANRAADVLIALREAKLAISTATVRKPTLDEVFLALTGHCSRRRRPRRSRADGHDLGRPTPSPPSPARQRPHRPRDTVSQTSPWRGGR